MGINILAIVEKKIAFDDAELEALVDDVNHSFGDTDEDQVRLAYFDWCDLFQGNPYKSRFNIEDALRDFNAEDRAPLYLITPKLDIKDLSKSKDLGEVTYTPDLEKFKAEMEPYRYGYFDQYHAILLKARL